MARQYLNRLTPFDKLLNPDGTPTVRFISIWQDLCAKSEEVDALQQEQIDAIQAAQDAADAANAAAVAADAAAVSAAAAASDAADAAVEITTGQELRDSYVDPLNVLSAADTGVVSITAHDRVYGGSGGSVAVSSGSVSGFSAGDYVTVYYSDPTRAGGSVTYQGTTSTIAQDGDIHIVGGAQIPVTGTEDGYGGYPPGFVPPYWSYP